MLSALHIPGDSAGRTDHHQGTRRFLSDDPDAGARLVFTHSKFPHQEFPLKTMSIVGSGLRNSQIPRRKLSTIQGLLPFAAMQRTFHHRFPPLLLFEEWKRSRISLCGKIN